MSIKITCYGPRGSIPAPSRKGFSTVEYGGNTSCYLVEAGPFTIILDMGSGILVAGDDLLKAGKGFGKEFVILLSHFHWDHIQGGPFAVPLFIGSNKFHFHGFAPSGSENHVPFDRIVEQVIASQQEAPNFPVPHQAMPGRKEYRTHHFQFSETFTYFCDEAGKLHHNATQVIGKAHETLPVDVKNDPRRWIKITTIPLNHPNGCLGYSTEYMGTKVVYCTDNEPLLYMNKEINKHAKDADWLLLDGQHTPEQLAGMTQTFGHGTPNNCVDQAKACGAKHLVIHHHDPRHDDAKIADMERQTVQYAVGVGYTGSMEFAKEGAVWEV